MKSFTVPPASEYAKALASLTMSKLQRKMLRTHYHAPNRTITYTELATGGEAKSKSYRAANSHYGTLARKLGEALGMTFIPSHTRPQPFYSSAIGMGNPYTDPGEHFELVMHHELAKAIAQLGWFENEKSLP